MVDAAIKSFPSKFDTEHNKSWYLAKFREENHPLIELADLKIPESEINSFVTKKFINDLLEKVGSALRFENISENNKRK